MSNDDSALLLGLVILLLLVVFAPVFSIWSLNLLFGLQIPVTLKTWAAALWLSMVVGGSRGTSKSKDKTDA